jgi:predicted RNase H-like nuclease (RuvC/YqgF family)
MNTESSGVSRSDGAIEVQRLTTAVKRLLIEFDAYRQRATSAEERVRELESALRDVSSGGVDPLTLGNRVQALEQENRFLARRLDRARQSVKRISARLQFLDEDR